MRNIVPEVYKKFFSIVVAQQVSNLDCCQMERNLRQGVPTQLTPICFQTFGVLTNKMPINGSHLGSASVLAPSIGGFPSCSLQQEVLRIQHEARVSGYDFLALLTWLFLGFPDTSASHHLFPPLPFFIFSHVLHWKFLPNHSSHNPTWENNIF